MPERNKLKITKEFLLKNMTKNGGWTRTQIESLGIKWPPTKGWHNKLIGKEISSSQILKFSLDYNNTQVK
jgi:hypothetical protein